jgi:hypothetical protein
MKTHLDILPPEQAALLIKKKRFWKKTMWNSVGFAFVVLILGVTGTFVAIFRLVPTVAEGASYSIDSKSAVMQILAISFLLISLSILVFLTALIRCLSLPKLPKSTASTPEPYDP